MLRETPYYKLNVRNPFLYAALQPSPPNPVTARGEGGNVAQACCAVEFLTFSALNKRLIYFDNP